MKRKMLLSIILFALTAIYPVMAQEARQPGSVDLTAQQKKREDLDRSMMHMKEIRLQMSTVTDKTERRKLMNEHMQMMKKMMSDMGIIGRGRTIAKSRAGGMKSGTQNISVQRLEKKMEVMQEMINGRIARQEIIMKEHKSY